jgi:hypothetical protein
MDYKKDDDTIGKAVDQMQTIIQSDKISIVALHRGV